MAIIASMFDIIVKSNQSKALNDGLGILYKLLSNIVTNPTEQKFRKINSTNAKISSTVFSL